MEKNLRAELSGELFSLAATELSESPENCLKAAQIAYKLGMPKYATKLTWDGLYAVTVHPNADIEAELMGLMLALRFWGLPVNT